MHWAGATVIFQQYIHSLRATTEKWSVQYLPSVWPGAVISFKRSIPLFLAVCYRCLSVRHGNQQRPPPLYAFKNGDVRDSDFDKRLICMGSNYQC